MCGGSQVLRTQATRATDTGMPETRYTHPSSSLVFHHWVQPHWSITPLMLDHHKPIWHYQTRIATKNARNLNWWSQLFPRHCYHIFQTVTDLTTRNWGKLVLLVIFFLLWLFVLCALIVPVEVYIQYTWSACFNKSTLLWIWNTEVFMYIIKYNACTYSV